MKNPFTLSSQDKKMMKDIEKKSGDRKLKQYLKGNGSDYKAELKTIRGLKMPKLNKDTQKEMIELQKKYKVKGKDLL